MSMTLQDLAIQSRREQRRSQEQEARNARKGRHGGKEFHVDDGTVQIIDIQPPSKQDQQFYAQVEQNNKIQDELLDEVSDAKWSYIVCFLVFPCVSCVCACAVYCPLV